ncbi:MAG: hypothetical protein LKE40_02840 [Spirochaetia bacterium]|jgi:flagellar biosynthesis GTPase FlhF|nr:hypothetical protein [Spirochaetia bacterium]
MEFLTFVGKDYDEAVKLARQKFGSAVRIHTRTTLAPSFRRRGGCSIQCYLVKEKGPEAEQVAKAKAQPPKSIEAPSEVVKDMRRTLLSNDFSEELTREVIGNLVWADAKDLTEMELRLVNRLVDSAGIDRDDMLHPPKFFVLHGPVGVGKTLALLKLAALYSEDVIDLSKRKVAFLTLGSAGTLAEEKHLPAMHVFHAADLIAFDKLAKDCFDEYDLVLVDQRGIDDELADAMLAHLPLAKVGHFYCIDARHKLRQLESDYAKFSAYEFKSAVVTMCDQTATFGNVLSFCHGTGLPLLFLSNGPNITGDLQQASGAYIMSLLTGFSLDFKSMWENGTSLVAGEGDAK